MKKSANNKSCKTVHNQKIDIDVTNETLQKLTALQAKHGNMFSFKTSKDSLAYFINEPALIKELLVKNHSNYKKGPGFERIEMLLGNGLIVSDGEIWRRSRRMIQPAFSRQNIHKLIQQMLLCSKNRESLWNKSIQSKALINITEEMGEFALELILRSIFGQDYDHLSSQEEGNLFSFLSKDSNRDLSVVMKMRNLRSHLLALIKRRKKDSHEQFDFLSMYLSTKDKSGKKFDDKELVDEIITLIVAGYETSAGTLNWAWYLIANNPNIEKRIHTEAKPIFSEESNLNYESVISMQYTQQVLEETLRLYPPVWLFSRKSIDDDNLGKYDIPVNSDLYLSPYILHRSREFWNNPEKFNPDRFDKTHKTENNNAFIPFSLGPRRCLGEYFSFLEMKIHLGYLINKFKIKKSHTEDPSLNLGINLRSKNDIFLEFKPR